jgi:hypothetical protein
MVTPRMFILLLGLVLANSSGSLSIPTDAPNCSLQSPPSDAGDVLGEEPEGDMKVFPRRTDFPRRYTGCQTSWYKTEAGWQQASIIYLERGKPVLFFLHAMFSVTDQDVRCRYNGKRVVSGNEGDCPDWSELILPSMLAGCARRVRESEEVVQQCREE